MAFCCFLGGCLIYLTLFVTSTRRLSGCFERVPRRARGCQMSSSLAPQRVRYVRVAIVGDSGSGKSTLTRALSGDFDERVERTSGVNPRVRLVDVFDVQANTMRPHFIELWDMGGRDEYKAERVALYNDLDGIILVHDLSLSRGPKQTEQNLKKWAREVAGSATFKTPSPDVVPWERKSLDGDMNNTHTSTSNPNILRNFQGLPVPVLVVGCKLDLEKNKNSTDSADDDFFGEARAGGFDPSERAVAFFYRLLVKVMKALKMNPEVGRGHKRKSSLLPSTIADLKRAFSADNLHEEFGNKSDASHTSSHSEILRGGGVKVCALNAESVDLPCFDSYFSELIDRRYRGGDGMTTSGGSVNGGFQFASVNSMGNQYAFSFPGSTTTGATLRNANHTMWMGGDRMDAGEGEEWGG